MRLLPLVGAALCCALLQAAPAARAAETFELGLLGSPNAPGWPWYIAIDKGFVAEAGLSPDIIYAPTPSGIMQQLAAGSLDIIDIGVVEPIHAVARGAPVAILRITGAVPPYELLANPAVKSIKDLKGKIFVIGGLIDINRVYLERVLKAAGLKDSDIDITTVGNTAGRYAALKSGAADATMLTPPFNFFAEAEGYNNIGLMTQFAGDLPFGSTDVSLAYAEKHRASLGKILAILDKASAWYDDPVNRDEAITILLKAMSSTDRDSVAKSYDYLRKIDYFGSPAVSRARLKTVMAEMKALGDTQEDVPLDKLVIAGMTPVTE